MTTKKIVRKFEVLTKEFSVRRGQWVYRAKVVDFDDAHQPVFVLEKHCFFGKKSSFRGSFNIGKPFWKEVLGEGGLISLTIKDFFDRVESSKTSGIQSKSVIVNK